jgi:hypothetical protein
VRSSNSAHQFLSSRTSRRIASIETWDGRTSVDRLFQEPTGFHHSNCRRGRIIPQIDLQIAAIAISPGNCTVATKDSDFQAIPGLDVEDWSKA